MIAKRNIHLIVGLAIPLLMIVFVAVSIYLPGFFIQPKIDFLYVTGEDYYGSHYSVQNEKLVKTITNYSEAYAPSIPPRESKLYLYDIVKNESRQVSFDEVQQFVLNSNNKSPDGFEIVNGSKNIGFFPFFFGSEQDYNTKYIKGRGVSKKLNTQLSGDYYNNFRFLGWIKK